MMTSEEKKWVKRLQKVLNECPSDRIGFYTIGDPTVSLYDTNANDEIDRLDIDFGLAVHELDAYLGEIIFPSCVHSTAG